MQIPLISKTCYASNGNKYTKTNSGKILGGAGLALGTNLVINNYRKSANYADFLKKTAERLKEQQKDIFNPEILKKSIEQGQKLTKYGTVAVMAFVGVTLGAIADFVINSKRKNSAEKKV